MKLTLKQQRFADEYIICGNATEAATKAGYKQPHVQGSQNLEKLSVKAYIEKRLEEISSAKTADAVEVLEYLTSVLRGESVAQIVVVEGNGDGMSSARRINKAPDEKERLKAAELLGKRYSLYTDKVDLLTGDIVIKVGEWDGNE